MNQKGIVHILMIILLLAGIVAGVYLVQKQQIFKPKAKETKDNAPKIYGYIAEFKQEPLSKKVGKVSVSSVQDQQSLDEEHKQAKQDIFNILNEGKVKSLTEDEKQKIITQEYTKAFNGVALNINEQQAEMIKKSAYIKGVYPDYEVKAFLNESVPMINANNVWQQRDNLGRNFTGHGATVAVIDTGADYTHPDLGSTSINERPFQSIVTSLDHPIANMTFSANKLVYSAGHKIYIRSLDTNQQTEITAFSPQSWVGKIAFDGRYLVYYAYYIDFSSFYPERSAISALFLYDLETGNHRKIQDAQGVGSIYIRNGKIIYGRNGNNEFVWRFRGPYIYEYNIATDSESSLPFQEVQNEINFPSILFKFQGDQIVVLQPESWRNPSLKHIVYNLDTNQRRDLACPEPGPILDFKGSKILYLAGLAGNEVQWGTYYLCDIDTGESTRLRYSGSAVSSVTPAAKSQFGNMVLNTVYEDKNVSANFDLMTWWSDPGFASIGNRVIYFGYGEWGGLAAYDMVQQRYVAVNLTTIDWDDRATLGDKICFSSDGGFIIYCHDYNSQDPYSLPQTVFNNKIVGGYNLISRDDNPLDDQGHGTHVAATIAGNGSLKGVAPDAKLVIYKAMNSGGSGRISDIIAALDRVIETRLDDNLSNNVDIVNMSLGMNCRSYTPSCGPDDPLSRAVDNSVDAGIVVVVSAGNIGPDPSTIGSPSTARKAITVGAVDKNRQIANFSSRGPVVIGSETINKPDVVAPGVSICAAEWDSIYRDRRCIDDRHISLRGTSMAAPHVAGLAALAKQAHPEWTPLQIKEAIKNSAVNLNYDVNTQGSGLIDALRLFESNPPTATPSPSPQPTPSPTPSPTPPPISLTLDNNIVVAGTAISVAWSNLNSGVEKDWVAIFKQSDPSEARYWKEWLFLGSCSRQSQSRIPASSGSCSIKVPDNLAVGIYEVRLMTNNTYNVVATSQSLIIGGGDNFIVAVGPNNVSSGQTVNLSWSGITTFKEKDWVGMFKVNDPTSAGYLKEWIFLATCSKQSQTNYVPGPAGNCTLTIPDNLPAGEYNFRFMTDNQYQVIGTTRSINVSR